MAKNKVQFQKGLSLGVFLSMYGTEKQCYETLFHICWPQGYICPECGYTGSCYVVSDGLNCFPGIENANSNHFLIPANKNKELSRSIFKWINTFSGNVKTAICGVYHSISDKHVPRYLVEYCYHFNRRFNLGEMIISLLKHSA